MLLSFPREHNLPRRYDPLTQAFLEATRGLDSLVSFIQKYITPEKNLEVSTPHPPAPAVSPSPNPSKPVNASPHQAAPGGKSAVDTKGVSGGGSIASGIKSLFNAASLSVPDRPLWRETCGGGGQESRKKWPDYNC